MQVFFETYFLSDWMFFEAVIV